MPVTKVKKKDIPKPIRYRTTPIKETEEWKDVQAVLIHGLKPQEAVEITFSQTTLTNLVGEKGLKNPLRLLRNLIRNKVKELSLDYDVWQQGGKDGKSIFIAGR